MAMFDPAIEKAIVERERAMGDAARITMLDEAAYVKASTQMLRRIRRYAERQVREHLQVMARHPADSAYHRRASREAARYAGQAEIATRLLIERGKEREEKEDEQWAL